MKSITKHLLCVILLFRALRIAVHCLVIAQLYDWNEETSIQTNKFHKKPVYTGGFFK